MQEKSIASVSPIAASYLVCVGRRAIKETAFMNKGDISMIIVSPLSFSHPLSLGFDLVFSGYYFFGGGGRVDFLIGIFRAYVCLYVSVT